MMSKKLTGDSSTLAVMEKLQAACAEAFTAIMSSLQPDMSEQAIADLLRAHLADRGFTKYWYDVPFIVLIGVERFRIGTTTTDYALKAPSQHVQLKPGDALHIDFSPMDSATGLWGDWSSTCIFRPSTPTERAQLAFLEQMRTLHRLGISRITADTTGADVAQYFINQFAHRNVKLLDVRHNVGHSLHAGPKAQADRIWLDLDNHQPLGPGLFTVEPGGITDDGRLVARFEEAVLIPETGSATIIGPSELVPLSV